MGAVAGITGDAGVVSMQGQAGIDPAFVGGAEAEQVVRESLAVLEDGLRSFLAAAALVSGFMSHTAVGVTSLHPFHFRSIFLRLSCACLIYSMWMSCYLATEDISHHCVRVACDAWHHRSGERR